MATQTRPAVAILASSGYTPSSGIWYDDATYMIFTSTTRRAVGYVNVQIQPFTIPTGSTINSVTAYMQRLWSSGASALITSAWMQMYYSATPRGTQFVESAFPTTETEVSVDAGTWTVAELNGNNMAIYVNTTRANTTTSTSHYVDILYVVVDYTAPVVTLTCTSRTTTRASIGPIADYEYDLPFIAGRLLELHYAKKELQRNLVTKGVSLTGSETLEELINLILTIHYHVYYEGTALFIATNSSSGGIVRYDVTGWPSPTLRFDTSADGLKNNSYACCFYMDYFFIVGGGKLKRIEPHTGAIAYEYTPTNTGAGEFDLTDGRYYFAYLQSLKAFDFYPAGNYTSYPSLYWNSIYQGCFYVWPDGDYLYVVGLYTIMKVQKSDGTVVAANTSYGLNSPQIQTSCIYVFGSYVFIGVEPTTDVWNVVKLNKSDLTYVGISPQIAISEPGFGRICRLKGFGSYLYVTGIALTNAIPVLTISTMAIAGSTGWNFDSYTDIVFDPAGVYGYACNWSAGSITTDPRYYRITLSSRAYSQFAPNPTHGRGCYRLALHWFPTQYNAGLSVYCAGGYSGTGGLLLYDGDPATPLKLLDTSVEAEYYPTWTNLGETGCYGNWVYVLYNSAIRKVHPALLEIRESSATISGSIYGAYIDEANGVFWIGKSGFFDRVNLGTLGISSYGPFQINGYSNGTMRAMASDGTYLVAVSQYGMIVISIPTMTKLAENIAYATKNSQAKVAIAGDYIYAVIDIGVNPNYEYRLMKFNKLDFTFVSQSAIISTSSSFFVYRVETYGNYVYVLTTDSSNVPIRRYNLTDLAAAGTGGSDSGWTDIAFYGDYIYAINLSAGAAITTHRLWKIPISNMSGGVYESRTSQWGATSMSLHNFA